MKTIKLRNLSEFGEKRNLWERLLTEFIGTSYLIGKTGEILKTYQKVKPKLHLSQVMQDISETHRWMSSRGENYALIAESTIAQNDFASMRHHQSNRHPHLVEIINPMHFPVS